MFWYHVHFRFRAEISRLQRIVELKTKEMNRVKRLAKTILDQVRWFAHVQLLNLLIILYLKRGLSSAASLNLILIFFFSFVANGSRTVFLGLTGIRQKWNYQKQVLHEMRQHVDGNVVTLVVTQKVASAFRKLFE